MHFVDDKSHWPVSGALIRCCCVVFTSTVDI